MAKILIVYATQKGATKEVCEFLQNELKCDICTAKEFSKEKSKEYDGFIFASPSYAYAELCDEWQDKLSDLKSYGIDKKVAILGVGNQERHPDSLCGGMVEFLPALKKATFIGQSDANGYKFDHSPAFINGKFIGLPVDFKGDSNWKNRVSSWAKSLNFS